MSAEQVNWEQLCETYRIENQRLREEVKALKANPKDECRWNNNEDECFWETACGTGFQFMNDGPKENDYRFCPSCGKPITLNPQTKP